jgi:IclR family KDG regulon transcriptional repressor
MANKYQAPIVKKAFTILNAIAKSSQGLRISDIASLLNISKSTVHGIIAALSEQGAVIQSSASKRYVIGMTLMELGKAAHERIDFKNIARPVMEELMEQCQESVFLGIQNGNRVTIGTALPLLAGATGKLFLSRMDTKNLHKYLNSNPLRKFTSNTIIDPEKYIRELDKVRKDGFAYDDEEYISGVRAVAAPIKQHGAYIPAIWVVGFKASMATDKIPAIIKQTRAAAFKINNSI